MRLTAQTTPHAPNTAPNPVEHFGYTGPEILDEEDYAPLAEIEHALEGCGQDMHEKEVAADNARNH